MLEISKASQPRNSGNNTGGHAAPANTIQSGGPYPDQQYYPKMTASAQELLTRVNSNTSSTIKQSKKKADQLSLQKRKNSEINPFVQSL